MDEYDQKAMDRLARYPSFWLSDTIYPGSRILTVQARAIRDFLAAAYRSDVSRDIEWPPKD